MIISGPYILVDTKITTLAAAVISIFLCNLRSLIFPPTSGLRRSSRVQSGHPTRSAFGDTPVVACGVIRYCSRNDASMRSREILF